MKKTLSIFLALLMLLTLIPTGIAFGAEPSWVIEDFESITDCSISGLSNQTNETVNGYKTVMGTTTGISFSKSISPAISITNYTKEYLSLRMEIYISNPDLLKSAGAPQIELTSSGKCDVNEIHWSITALNLKAGWNSLILDFSRATDTGGTLDISNINYIRIYASFSAETTLGIGSVRVVPSHGGIAFDGSFAIVKEDMSALPQTVEAWYLPNDYNTSEWIITDCNGTDGTYDSYGSTTLRAVVDGTATYLQAEVPSGGYFSIRKDMTNGGATVLPQGYSLNELALALRFYVSDATAIPDGSLEIASTKMDTDELAWGYNSLNLKNGWNDLLLPLSQAGKTGEFALTSVKWFRFYSSTLTAACTIKMDDVKIVTIASQNQRLITDFDNTDAIPVTDSCSNNTKTYTTDSGATVLKCVVPASQWFSLRHETLPSTSGITLPSGFGMDELGLSLRFYVDDVSRIKSANIELANTTMDTNEIFWDLHCLSTIKNGWNEITLPFSTCHGPVNGEFTLSPIKWWRFNLTATDAGGFTAMLDYLKIVTLVEDETDPSQVINRRQYLFSYTDTNDNTIGLCTVEGGALQFVTANETFDLGVSLIGNAWTHVACTIAPSAKTAKIYLDGALISTVNFTSDTPAEGALYVGLGPKGFDGMVFSGRIGDVRVWTDVRTASEISSNYNSVINTATEGLYANWRLNENLNFISVVPKDSIGTNHASVLWREWRSDWIEYEEPENYDYTFAVVPDPQILAALYPDVYYKLFQYIADNAESQKIEYVLGLGDITDSNSVAQWEVARAAFDIIEGKVPYANVLGNHDYGDWTQPYRDTTRYNTYFKYSDHSKRSDWGGAYEENVMDNVYYLFNVGNIPYMVMCLEFLPRDGVIDWANQVVAAHPNHNVIVLTHGYIDGQSGNIGSEPQSDYGFIINNPDPYNGGQKIWTKFISQHENIKMSLCGHTFCKDDNVIMRADAGVNGNTVIQLCINAQTLDQSYFEKTGVGLLGLLRFSENGEKVALQYYSPHTGLCFREVNQLSFTIDSPIVNTFTKHTDNLSPIFHVGVTTADSSYTNWNDYRYIAQEFIPAEEKLYGVKIPLNITSDTVDLHMEIRSDVNGKALYSSDTTLVSQGNKMAWYTVPMNATLSPGQTYYVVYYLTSKHSSNVCIAYGTDFGVNGATYPGQVWKMSDGGGVTFSPLQKQLQFGFELLTDQNVDSVNLNNVISLIDALPITITIVNRPDVETARDAYDTLGDVEKTLVRNISKLTEAETVIARLLEDEQALIQSVIDKIDDIPDDILYTDKSKVEDARAAYDALTDTQKESVTNADKLFAAEQTMTGIVDDYNAAQEVVSQIDDLPDKLTLDDEADVIAARDAYDALSQGAKEYVTNLNKLLTAEQTIETLKNAEPSIVYGDLDNNTEVTSADALLALQNAVSKVDFTDKQIKAADVNNDGDVTSADALLILQKAVNKIEAFPVEL